MLRFLIDGLMYDFLIVGQGIAGTALAWTLLERGASVFIIDSGSRSTSSHLAAGLITPVGGKRLTIAPGFEQLMLQARAHYRYVEQITGCAYLLEQPALRICLSPGEAAVFEERRRGIQSHIGAVSPPPAAGLATGIARFQMTQAARVNVSSYLDDSCAAFGERGLYHQGTVTAGRIKTRTNLAEIGDGIDVCAHQLVFCGGWADATNPWLPSGAFNSAKGEMLTVHIPGLDERRTVHAAHSWLAPCRRPQVYRCGATYDHDDLSPKITQSARQMLSRRLASYVSLPFEILGQHAAIRPVGMGRMPIIGRHPEHPQIAWFNGLGSKGALWAPALARVLAAHLLDHAPLNTDLVLPPGAIGSSSRR